MIKKKIENINIRCCWHPPTISKTTAWYALIIHQYIYTPYFLFMCWKLETLQPCVRSAVCV